MISIGKLMAISDGICHYCKNECVKRSAGEKVTGRTPTRDHVVPASIGGSNKYQNIILSCRDCNNKRGTALFYCDCLGCKNKIYSFLYDPSGVGKIFWGIINHNKPKITYDINQRWVVSIGHCKKTFSSHSEAIDFALNTGFTQDKEYEIYG